jgi:hypothetical protein
MEIEHQCPQCGAPVTLEEADRLLSCAYCRVKLYLIPKGYQRYYLAPAEPEGRDIIFVPYWRLKGMSFVCKPYAVEPRIVDASHLATAGCGFPESLGLRTQALKLRFASSLKGSRFLRVQKPLEGFPILGEPATARDDPDPPEDTPFHRAFIGEIASIIYSPIFIEGNRIFDGIVNRPISATEPGNRPQGFVFEEKQDWPIRFVPILCPNCGWELTAERDSCILLCNKCISAWEAGPSSLMRVELGVLPSKVHGKDMMYLPFWRMKVKGAGLELGSYADLIRLANLPKAIKKEWEQERIYFWSPAFKVPPALFLRLASQITMANPLQPPEAAMPESRFYPVSLPVKEATEGLKTTLANIALNKKRLFPKLSEITMEAQDTQLVFLPFRETTNELIQPELNCSIQRNALRVGGNI